MQAQTETIRWGWQGKILEIGLDRMGRGPAVLLLPALSSISMREEMRPLQERLAKDYGTVAIDWPGFGPLAKPNVAWEPAAYRAFLKHVLADVVPYPIATISAGHGATYVLAQAADDPGSTGRICLLSPTWRGPLPTMMDRRSPVFAAIGRAADPPVIGSILYRANVNPFVIRMMTRGHVYADPDWLERDGRMKEKMVVTRRGARHASVRFVAGELDPVRSREEFLALAGAVKKPVLVLYSAGMPGKSKVEVETLRTIPNIRLVELPEGKLSMYEEFPEPVAREVLKFLGEAVPPERAPAEPNPGTAGS